MNESDLAFEYPVFNRPFADADSLGRLFYS
jgi:hypothetical protein